MINLQNPTLIPSATLITDSFTPTGGGDSFLTQLTRVNGSPVSAALEIRSTNGGVLIPRLTTAQINGLNATDALMVYDTTVGAFKFHQSGGYVEYDTGGGAGYGPGVPTYLQDTTSALSDNVSMGTPATNFIGGAIDNSTFGSGVAGLGISGDKNSFFGCDAAGAAHANINNCSGFGYGALALNQNNTNSAFGSLAGNSNTTGNVDAFGFEALALNIDGLANVAVGNSSLSSNIHGNYLTSMGFQALTHVTANASSAFGCQAGYSNVSSIGVSAFGYQAAYSTASGGDPAVDGTVSAFGYQAAYSNIDGVGLVGIGDSALYYNTHGSGNTAVGSASCIYNDIGFNNTSVGYSSLGVYNSSPVTYANNTTVGSFSQAYMQTGGDNSSLGFQSLYANLTGNQNSAVGSNCLFSNTASQNSAFGFNAAFSNTTGQNVDAFGFQCLYSNTTESEICAFGSNCLYHNVAGQNSAFGYQAGYSNTTGLIDAFGCQSLYSNVSGNYNYAFGFQSLFSNVSGENNSAFSSQSLLSNISGSQNSAFGIQSLSNSLGDYNTAFGYNSGISFQNGSNNCFFGATTALDALNLNNCTFIGTNSGTYDGSSYVDGLSNATAIGEGTQVTISNALILGNGAKVGIGTSAPANILHIVGKFQSKGITSGFTGSDSIKSQNGLSTSGTGTATVSYAIPTSVPTSVCVKVRIAVMNTAGTKSGYAETIGAAFWNGSTTASVGTLPTIVFTATAAYAPTAAWSVSGNNLVLTVTGVAASNEVWVTSSELFATTNSTA